MTDTTADPTGTATRRPHGRDEVVDSLIAAAAELFSDRGVADVTVREIATAANVNPGLLHRHFGGKDDLVKRVFERIAEDSVEQIQELDHDDQRVREVARIVFDHGLEHLAFAKILAGVLLHQTSPSAVLPEDGPLRQLLAEMRELRPDQDVELDADFAASVALSLGWFLFAPAIAVLLGSNDLSSTMKSLTPAIREAALDLATRTTSNPS